MYLINEWYILFQVTLCMSVFDLSIIEVFKHYCIGFDCMTFIRKTFNIFWSNHNNYKPEYSAHSHVFMRYVFPDRLIFEWLHGILFDQEELNRTF